MEHLKRRAQRDLQAGNFKAAYTRQVSYIVSGEFVEAANLGIPIACCYSCEHLIRIRADSGGTCRYTEALDLEVDRDTQKKAPQQSIAGI